MHILVRHPGCECTLLGLGKTIAIQCTCDRGSFSGSVNIDSSDVLSPYPLSAPEFEQLRAALGGFNATHATVACSRQFSQNVVSRILQRFNVYHMHDISQQACFAGYLRKEMMEHRLLLAISKESGEEYVKVSVHADDPVLCTTISDALKKYVVL